MLKWPNVFREQDLYNNGVRFLELLSLTPSSWCFGWENMASFIFIIY